MVFLALQIFGIYMIKNHETVTLEEVLLPGKDMIAAGYCMYGSSCTVINQASSTHARPWDWLYCKRTIWISNLLQLVLSTGSGVNGFTLDPSLGEFIMTHPEIKVSCATANAIYLCFWKITKKYNNHILCFVLHLLQIPPKGKIYSVNEGNAKNWDTPTAKYVMITLQEYCYFLN